MGMGAVLNEVAGPALVAIHSAQSNVSAVVEPEQDPFRLFGRDFQPLASPDLLKTLYLEGEKRL